MIQVTMRRVDDLNMQIYLINQEIMQIKRDHQTELGRTEEEMARKIAELEQRIISSQKPVNKSYPDVDPFHERPFLNPFV